MKMGSFTDYVLNRIKRNKNFLCMISGQTGSGKSWSALSIAEQLDKDFNVRRVVFRARELMQLINSGELSSGSVIIWDEAGIDLSNRNWQNPVNKMLNYLIQTFRHKNFILIFTAPYSDFIDTATKKLFHADLRTVGINQTKKTCAIKPKLLQYNPDLKKWYAKYLRVMKKGEGMRTVRRWLVRQPSKELVNAYEKKKTTFTNALNDSIEQELNRRSSERHNNTLTPLQEKVVDCWKQGIIVQTKIAEKLGKKQGRISIIESMLRKKGYFKEKYRNNPKK